MGVRALALWQRQATVTRRFAVDPAVISSMDLDDERVVSDVLR